MSTTITYKGNTLATVSNTTKTLKTAGKYMEDDVQLTDTSSTIVVSETLDTNGGIIKTISTTDEVNLQVKTIAPTTTQQTVNPDTGYDGFSQVIVGAGSGGGSQAILQDKSYTVSGAGTTTIIPDSGYDAMSSVALSVPSATPFVGNRNERFYDDNGIRRWGIDTFIEVDASEGDIAGWLPDEYSQVLPLSRPAVPLNTTITPTTSAQTVGGAKYMMEGAVTVAAMPTGTAGTPIASKGSVSNHSISVTPSVTNTTGYITGGTKTGTAVTVSASELVSGSETKTSNGTYDVTNLAELIVNVSGGGGGDTTGIQIGTISTTATSNTSLTFTGLAGAPTSLVIISTDEIATQSTPHVATIAWDGNNTFGQEITNTSNAQVTAVTNGPFMPSYNNGTLTVGLSGVEVIDGNDYNLIYTYNGSDIRTSNVQVGSGATSITFTGIEEEPSYFSCIFKSNFSTSNGYQRAIAVVYDGTDIYGLEMDSSAKPSNAHWSYTYNNGSLTITSQGTNAGGYFHQPGYYQLTYAIGSSGGVVINNQNKSVTPSETQQTITADEGYTGLGTVTVGAISSTYVGSSIARRGDNNMSGAADEEYFVVSAAAGYYQSSAEYYIPLSTAGTPMATKGAVSNHSISVTPSVTNTTGYITGSTKTGTAVTVSASELVSGSETKTSNGTYDVTNLAELVVNVSSGSPTIQSLTVTPTTSQQVFNASGVDGYKPVTVAAMPTMTLPTSAAASATSGYTSKATISRSTSDQYINIAPGYNSAGGYYKISAVANGSATAPASISGTAASVSTGTNTLTLTKTVSVTPTVSAGYVSAGTAGNSSVSLTASVTTKAAATITPTTTNQTIAAGTYITGTQTIVGDADLVGSNILSTANIFGVQGTVVVQNYYTGSSAPSSSTGSNGDLYLQS